MANKIVIGDPQSPTAVIFDDEILSISRESAVSLIGEELYIDTFTPVLDYDAESADGSVEVFKPTDYDGIMTADSVVFATRAVANLRTLPYGTIVSYYMDDNLVGKYYLNHVERLGKTKYRLDCMSYIGMLDKQMHEGGIYTGQTFSEVLSEILDIPASNLYIADDVKNLEIYGYLPYATRRQNLYQLTMAMGVSILRTDEGDMRFAFLDNSSAIRAVLPENIFEGGTVTYENHASRVEVVEHGYYYYPSTQEEVLFDNTGDEAVTGALILFNKPVYAPSVQVGSGNLTLTDIGTNHCTATGVGTIVGIPYVHTTRVIAKDNTDASATDKVVRVEDATLITATNSENAARRLAAYYFSANKFRSDVKVDDTIKCGLRYNVPNAYMEESQAYITKMSGRVTSFERVTCEFINDYEPTGSGNTFDNVTSPIDATTSGTWSIPASVFQKDYPLVRVVLIGKGKTGENGQAGEDGEQTDSQFYSLGGMGGEGGAGGNGGNILIQTLDCTGISQFSYSTDTNGEIHLSGGTYSLSSENGVASPTGYFEQMTQTTYAEPGIAGQRGANGGRGGRYNPKAAQISATSGDIVTYDGVEYYGGGYAENTYYQAGTGINQSGMQNTSLYVGSGGGGGGAVGDYGEYGHSAIFPRPANYIGVGWGGDGGNGANAPAVKSVYGTGGNGGHGGGGGGGGGSWVYYHDSSGTVIDTTGVRGGTGGTGGQGSVGYKGCIIIYY